MSDEILETPLATPEIRVGNLFPQLSDDSSFDSVASPATEENYWDLLKSTRDSKAKKARHQARVLDFGTEDERITSARKRALKQKANMKMDWYPADKARQALVEMKKLDVGKGYKAVIVRDTSVKPPPMPPTPPPVPRSINTMLMRGAEALAKLSQKQVENTPEKQVEKLTETEADPPPSPLSVDDEKPPPFHLDHKAGRRAPHAENTCPGCFCSTCPRRQYMCDAVAAANSLRGMKKELMMSREQRVDWFVRIYNRMKGVHPNSRYGIDCALKYANENLRYLSAAYILKYGRSTVTYEEEPSDDDDFDNFSYVSSKYARQLADYEEYTTGDDESGFPEKSEKSKTSDLKWV